MKPGQYKMCRSKNFPMPESASGSKSKLKLPGNIQTICLLSDQQPGTYQLHIVDNKQKSNQKQSKESNLVIFFNQHEYVERQFSHIFRMISNDHLNTINLPQSQTYHQKMKNAKKSLMNTISHNVDIYPRNLIIFPVLDTQIYNQIVYSQAPLDQSRTSNQSSNSNQQCMFKGIIDEFIKNKESQTTISMSIISIKKDGSLIDQLDMQWLSESRQIDLSIKQKAKLKVKKNQRQIKTFDLNRQQIESWEEANQIIKNYCQISDYIEKWRVYEDHCNDCKNGEIFQISQVLIDSEYGTIMKTIRKTFILRINQYLSSSNLIMMKISHALECLIQQTTHCNIRDYPLTLFLSECFDPANKFHITLFTQLGAVETLKEECVCLSMNLKVPGKHKYLKNYCDNEKIIKKLKPIAEIFIPVSKQEKTLQLTDKVKMGEKSIRLYDQSCKVTSKSFSYETYSSFNKKRMQEKQIVVEEPISNPNPRDQANLSLIQVYGKNLNNKRNSQHRFSSERTPI